MTEAIRYALAVFLMSTTVEFNDCNTCDGNTCTALNCYPIEMNDDQDIVLGEGEGELVFSDLPSAVVFWSESKAELCLQLHGAPRLFLGDCKTPYDGNDAGLKALIVAFKHWGYTCKQKGRDYPPSSELLKKIVHACLDGGCRGKEICTESLVECIYINNKGEIQ